MHTTEMSVQLSNDWSSFSIGGAVCQRDRRKLGLQVLNGLWGWGLELEKGGEFQSGRFITAGYRMGGKAEEEGRGGERLVGGTR